MASNIKNSLPPGDNWLADMTDEEAMSKKKARTEGAKSLQIPLGVNTTSTTGTIGTV